MKKLVLSIFCILLCLLTVSVQAQVENPIQFNTGSENVYVFKDPRIDMLIQKQRYLNTLALRNIVGYRVQVISTIDRGKASDARAKLMRQFPEYHTYLTYQSPYFRVRIGDFIQKDSAQSLQSKLEQYFPNGVFTVTDHIHVDPKVLLHQVKADHGTKN